MKKQKLYSTNEFAELAGTTRDRLHHYDKIGLLKPEVRGENKYRYYSTGQIAIINLIRTFLESGLSLDTIKNFKNNRTPEYTKEILAQQLAVIDQKMDMWSKSRKLLLNFRQIIDSTDGVDENAVTIQQLPEKKILIGPLNNYSDGKTDYDALREFYQTISEKYPKLDLNYPVWGIFSKDSFMNEEHHWPDRYYLFTPEGHDARPAGSYATGYMRGGYRDGAELFARLRDYIYRNDFEICGNIYKEYPLNEICIAREQDYLIRVMVSVRKKRRR